MKARLPRLKLSEQIPGSAKFNQWIDDILTYIENLRNFSGSGVASVTTGPTGVHIHVPDFPYELVKTTGTISARSTTTPGSGTVTFQMYNLTTSTFSDDAARTNVTVYNFSANSTLTPTGKYGVVVKKWGVYWLISVEC